MEDAMEDMMQGIVYDPKEGPLCHECPLYEDGIVVYDSDPPRIGWSGLSLVGEMPGRQEVQTGSVFVGASGKMLNAIFEREQVTHPHVTNCIRCGLKGGAKPTKKEMKAAAECCRPLLMHNLEALKTRVVCCIGGSSLESVMDLKGIEKYRGACWEPIEGEPWITTCTIHPAGVLRQEARRIWIELLRDDLVKAHRLALGELELWEPEVHDAADVDALCTFLDEVYENRIPMSCDVETDSIDALTANLRTIGIATRKGGAYSLPHPDWYPDFWEPGDWERVNERLTAIFDDPNQAVVFQNKIYDVPVLEQERYYGHIAAIREDTLLLHHAVYPKLPHDLQSQTCQFLASPPWKSEFDDKSNGWEKNEDETEEEMAGLLWYNAADGASTIENFHIMRPMLSANNVSSVYSCDREMMDIAIDWYKRGILIDMKQVEKLKLKYYNDEETGLLNDLDRQIDETAQEYGLEDFNPNSPKQLADLLFKRMQLPPTSVTPSGAMSTAKDELLKLYDAHPFIPMLIAYRKHSKLYSTYVKNIHTKLHDDGRLHAIGNITATPSGRFGFKPAIQNWPYKGSKARVNMRGIMVAPPGYHYIGADYSALELRLFALLAGEHKLIEMFNDGADVHSVHAENFFGSIFTEAVARSKDPKLSEAERKEAKKLLKALRTRGKPVTFGKNYGAQAETLFKTIREDRMDEDPDDLFREVKHMSDVFDEMYPMLNVARDYWQQEGCRDFNLRTFKTLRMRKFPLGDVSFTVAANHPVQGGAGDIANEGTIKWVNELKQVGRYWNDCVYPTIQVHDFLGAECREDLAEEEAQRLEDCLYTEVTYTSPVSGTTNTMKFPAEASIGHSVADV